MSGSEYGFEICNGTPCDDAQLFLDADQRLTSLLDRVSGAAFQVLGARAEVSDNRSVLRSVVDAQIEINLDSYNAILDSRESTRAQIAQFCGRCAGALNGFCPNFAAE
jgi:hypothetical protein